MARFKLSGPRKGDPPKRCGASAPELPAVLGRSNPALPGGALACHRHRLTHLVEDSHKNGMLQGADLQPVSKHFAH